MAAIYTAFCTIGKLGNTAQVMHAGIYHAVLPLTTAFLTFPIWPNKLKNARFAAFFGRSVLGRFYFFAGTLLVIMSYFHHMQVMVINLLMAVLLLRWPLALFLALTVTSLAVYFFTRYTGTHLPLSISDQCRRSI